MSTISNVKYLVISLLFVSCQNWWEGHVFTLPSGEKVEVELAWNLKQQTIGMSGRKTYPKDQGLLFYYLKDEPRHFWMPDTYFDLDIFFLDQNFRVLSVERNVPHHPGRRGRIPRIKGYTSRHVFEMRADSSLSKKIKVNDQLKFSGSISQIELNIRKGQ